MGTPGIVHGNFTLSFTSSSFSLAGSLCTSASLLSPFLCSALSAKERDAHLNESQSFSLFPARLLLRSSSLHPVLLSILHPLWACQQMCKSSYPSITVWAFHVEDSHLAWHSQNTPPPNAVVEKKEKEKTSCISWIVCCGVTSCR